MTIKLTAAGVERDLNAKLFGFKESAAQVKAAHKEAREAILNDPMTSDLAKDQLLDALKADTRAKLDGLRADQSAHIAGLKSTLEKQVRGTQATDAASVVSRRDAADRARRIEDKDEAMAVLNDAIANGDADMAHAIGNRARNTGMFGVAEAYTAAFPDTSDSAAALAYVEEVSTGPAFNVANSATFSAPLD